MTILAIAVLAAAVYQLSIFVAVAASKRTTSGYHVALALLGTPLVAAALAIAVLA